MQQLLAQTTENNKKTPKSRKMARQFSLYFSAALVGYLVDFGVLIASKELLGLHYLLAAALGFIAGLVVVYILSDKYVFSNPKIASKGANFALFGVIGVIGLGVLSLFMWLFTDVVGLAYVLSKVVATVFVYTWNFFARRALYHN